MKMGSQVNSSDAMQTDYHLARDAGQLLDAEINMKLGEGFSMQFNFIQYRHPGVAKLAEQLAEFTGGLFVNVNAYMTPSGTRKAFPEHYDPWDVFVLQVRGTKKWSLYQSFITLPHPHQVAKLKHLTTMDTPWKGESPKKIHELIMHPGDLLYMPRGLIHAAESTSFEDSPGSDTPAVPSLHLSFGANIAGTTDLLLTWETVLHFSLQSTGQGRHSSPLRCPLPANSLFASAIDSVFQNAVAGDDHAQDEDGNGSMSRPPVPTWQSLLHLLVYATASEEGQGTESSYLLRRAFLPNPGFRILPPLPDLEDAADPPLPSAKLAALLDNFHSSVLKVLHAMQPDASEDAVQAMLWAAAEQARTHPRRRSTEGARNFFFDRWMSSSKSSDGDTAGGIGVDPYACLAPWFQFDEATSALVMLQTIANHWAAQANLMSALYPFRKEYQKQKQKVPSL
jgi:hypothetical protein